MKIFGEIKISVRLGIGSIYTHTYHQLDEFMCISMIQPIELAAFEHSDVSVLYTDKTIHFVFTVLFLHHSLKSFGDKKNNNIPKRKI